MKKILFTATALAVMATTAFAGCEVGNRGTVLSDGDLYGEMVVKTYTENGALLAVYTGADLGVDLMDKAAVEAATGCTGFSHERTKVRAGDDGIIGTADDTKRLFSYW